MGEDFVEKQYMCNVCKKQHKVRLSKSIIEGQKSFPVSYLYLHGDLDNILSTLYIDANLNIRGHETVELKSEDNIFSQGQAQAIVSKLMDQVTLLQKENEELVEKYEKLKTEYEKLKNK